MRPVGSTQVAEDVSLLAKTLRDGFNNAIAAGVDIKSGLSEEINAKCVFVHGLARVVQRCGMRQVEDDILRHSRQCGPSRVVIMGDSFHGFNFFEDTCHMDRFLDITKCHREHGVALVSTAPRWL